MYSETLICAGLDGVHRNKIEVIPAGSRPGSFPFQRTIEKSLFYNNPKEEDAGEQTSGMTDLVLTKSNNRGVEDSRQKHSGMTLFYNGFTLIELLVVVLIIGILAAVALPQYQQTILKSQYSELKTKARVLANAMQLYYLSNGTYATSLDQLDVNFQITSETKNTSSFYIYFLDSSWCEMYFVAENKHTICGKTVSNTYILYTQEHHGDYQLCTVYSKNLNDRFNKFCQNETGKNSSEANCSTKGSYCSYSY